MPQHAEEKMVGSILLPSADEVNRFGEPETDIRDDIKAAVFLHTGTRMGKVAANGMETLAREKRSREKPWPRPK